MESRESIPCSVFVSTGTPRTGKIVFAAAIPGRCADPPAPAMITRMPRFSAASAYSNRRSGVRCAETTRVSLATPRESRICAACCIVSQSDFEPMIIPTSGSGIGILEVIVLQIILVGNADVGENLLLLVVVELALVLQLEQQIADAAKAFPMMGSDTVRGETNHVLARGVPGVVIPDVLRITLRQPRHQQITRDFGEDRRASDAEAATIASHDRGVRDRQRTHRASVDDDVVRLDAQARECALHCQHARLIDVDCVDLSYGCCADRKSNSALADLDGETY